MDDNFSTDLYAHAPWRPKRNGSLSSEIYQSIALDSIKSLGVKRVILSACDYHFFERYSQNALDYEASDCQIIYTLGVFSSKDESVFPCRPTWVLAPSSGTSARWSSGWKTAWHPDDPDGWGT